MRLILIVEGYLTTLMPEGPAVEQEAFGPGFQVTRYAEWEKIPAEQVAQAEGIIIRPGVPLPADRIASLRNCRVIVSLGVGYEHIDLVAAKERTIPVCNVPDYGIEEVADGALAMMLALHKKLWVCQYRSRDGKIQWDWRIHRPIRRASQTTVGVMGLGPIGMSFARKAQAIGYSVAFLDPFLPRGIEKSLRLKRVHDRKELLNASDIVSLHVPVTRETVGMVDQNFLAAMKPAAILINVSRGGLFKNMDVLYETLRERREFSIGADVLPEEPPPDHPLLKAWQTGADWLGGRLLLTPHSSFYSEEACYELRRFAADAASHVVKGGRPYNWLNPG